MPLRVDYCSTEAARYAVTHWHYSQALPTPPIVRFGVWEDGRFIGCALFSRGASSNLLRPYGLESTQGCELTRVALDHHDSPVSRIVSVAIRLLRKSNPNLRLIISFADPNQGHEGVIYQAMNWIYTGKTTEGIEYVERRTGKRWHSRQVSEKGYNIQYGEVRRCPRPSDCEQVRLLGKHRYLYPLDEETKSRIMALKLAYPRCATSETSDTSRNPPPRRRASQREKGGAAPTVALNAIEGS